MPEDRRVLGRPNSPFGGLWIGIVVNVHVNVGAPLGLLEVGREPVEHVKIGRRAIRAKILFESWTDVRIGRHHSYRST
jgi:hypothetical protein